MYAKMTEAFSFRIVICILIVSTITHNGMLRADRLKIHDVGPDQQNSLDNAEDLSYNIANQFFDPIMHRSLCKVSATYIDCSKRKLAGVPTEEFPDTAIRYNLAGNFIKCIPDRAFSRYTVLKGLILAYNNISVLGHFSFLGLTHLDFLDLSHNKLIMTASTFPDEVFAPLSSLKTLLLCANTPYNMLNRTDMRYPDLALSKLTSLESLTMDGLSSKDLGPGFLNLTNLKNLSFGGKPFGNCRLISLSNTMFQYVPNLELLAIDLCSLVGNKIEAGAFSPLQKLAKLNIENNQNIGFEFLNRVTHGFANSTSLKTLFIDKIVMHDSLPICLSSSYISHFPQHLETLFVGENCLGGIDRDVIGKLSPSLKFLNVESNSFVFGTYFIDLHKMKNLTVLLYNTQSIASGMPKNFPRRSDEFTHSHCSIYETRKGDPLQNQSFVLRLPPNLQRLEMNRAGLNRRLNQLHIDPVNSLQNLSAEGNYFPQLDGPITGLHSLKTLKLGSNNIQEISTSFFQYFMSLRTLDLGNNNLGHYFSSPRTNSVFLHLTNLTCLNLTLNGITHLPKDVFVGLVSLKALHLGNNPLENFDVEISSMGKVEYLDLQSTRIAFLTVDTRTHVDSLISQGSLEVKLNMAKTPIACNCEHLDFVKWLVESEVVLEDKSNYTCLNPDSSIKSISDFYLSTLQTLNRECTSNTILFFCAGAVTFLALSIITGIVIYRLRWKLRYLYYAAYLQYKKTGKVIENYEFDAFISYDSDDVRFVVDKLSPELESRGLKLLIHNRHFTAGEPIASNIVRAVCNSRKTVVVLTRALMDSYWCGFEIQMANMEAVQKNRRVLIFLLMEKISENELGMELLFNIRNNTYIPFPDPLPDGVNMGRLWDKLTADIRS